MDILFSLDNILNNLNECWVQELNRRYDQHVQAGQLDDIDISKAYPTLTDLQIHMPYLDGTLYAQVGPVKPAQALIKELANKHNVYVVTSNIFGVKQDALLQYLRNGIGLSPLRVTQYMLEFVWNKYPDIPRDNIIITPRKGLIKCDILVEDNPEHLCQMRRCARILLDKCYNRLEDDGRFNIMRAKGWDEVRLRIMEV